jgi:Tol biopolymer transport system component
VLSDGQSIVYSSGSDPSAIWLKEDGEGAHPLVSDNYRNRLPLWDPQRNRILYSSDKSGFFNIWSIELQPGAAGKQLTSLSMDVGRMTLDPASGAIIFERVETTYEIHVYDSGTGVDKVAVSSRTRLSDISWNGPKQITYVRLTRKPQIWETNASGENPKMIMSDNYSNNYGAWSPDGTIFAFISNRSGTSELWMWQRSLGKTEQLTDSAAPKQDVAWSKDSRAIAYCAAGERRPQICILDVTTRKAKSLATPHSPSRPNWSWDNRWIYYQAQRERDLPQIYRISTDGGAPQQIYPAGLSPSISASGELLFLSADRRSVLRVGKDKGQAETLLTAPNGSKLMEVRYSPDGKIVSYLTERKNSDIVSVSPAPR